MAANSQKDDPRRKDIGFDEWLSNRVVGICLYKPKADNEFYWDAEGMRAAWIAGASSVVSETEPKLEAAMKMCLGWQQIAESCREALKETASLLETASTVGYGDIDEEQWEALEDQVKAALKSAAPQVSNPASHEPASTDKASSLGAGNTEAGELPAAAAPSCVVVPPEPTEAMLEAGDLFFNNASFKSVSPAQLGAIYRAMLAAAPSQPVTTNGSSDER